MLPYPIPSYPILPYHLPSLIPSSSLMFAWLPPEPLPICVPTPEHGSPSLRFCITILLRITVRICACMRVAVIPLFSTCFCHPDMSLCIPDNAVVIDTVQRYGISESSANKNGLPKLKALRSARGSFPVARLRMALRCESGLPPKGASHNRCFAVQPCSPTAYTRNSPSALAANNGSPFPRLPWRT